MDMKRKLVNFFPWAEPEGPDSFGLLLDLEIHVYLLTTMKMMKTKVGNKDVWCSTRLK